MLSNSYKQRIQALIDELKTNSSLPIDTEIEIKGRVPTSVSSEFITNKEQGDWAERVVFNAINSQEENYIAVKYGRSDSLSAGDSGFKQFYEEYQKELNTIGKLPDLLIFKRSEYEEGMEKHEEGIKKAICAIEVRSSSFLIEKYNYFMQDKIKKAEEKIEELRRNLFNNEKLSSLLKKRNPTLFDILRDTPLKKFKEGLTIKFSKLSSNDDLIELSNTIKSIKENIKILQTRDYLSITPKLEDIALVNRWIQNFNIPHYYLQVFFDKAYIISFEDILNISANSDNEGVKFFIERDAKNQGKTTIKIDVSTQESKLIIDKIQMPSHSSKLKELDRGRLLFYIHFGDSDSNLCNSVLRDKVLK